MFKVWDSATGTPESFYHLGSALNFARNEAFGNTVAVTDPDGNLVAERIGDGRFRVIR